MKVLTISNWFLYESKYNKSFSILAVLISAFLWSNLIRVSWNVWSSIFSFTFGQSCMRADSVCEYLFHGITIGALREVFIFLILDEL